MIIKSMLYVFFGGGLGSVIRLWISTQLNPTQKIGFSPGTFVINLLSCLIAGFLAGLLTRNVVDERIKLLLLTGFCGGFSTFSTYIIESYNLLATGQYLLFLGYVLGSMFLGLLFCAIGIYLAQIIF